MFTRPSTSKGAQSAVPICSEVPPVAPTNSATAAKLDASCTAELSSPSTWRTFFVNTTMAAYMTADIPPQKSPHPEAPSPSARPFTSSTPTSTRPNPASFARVSRSPNSHGDRAATMMGPQ